MPRSGPVYTLPESPFVPNTVISSADVNSDFDDIALALTASLPSNGAGGMSAVLPLDATGFSYTVDPDTGMSRSGANTQIITCGGIDTVLVNTTGMSITGNFGVSGIILQNNHAVLMIGEVRIWSGIAVPNSEWVLCNGQTLLRATYPSLWTFAAAEIAGGSVLFTNGNGTTTFTVPDNRGRIAAMIDGTGKLTSPTFSPNGTTAGAINSGTTQTVTLVAANLPAYTPAGTITNGAITNGAITNGVITITNGAITVTGTASNNTPTASAAVAAGSVAGSYGAASLTASQATTTASQAGTTQATTTQATSTFAGTAAPGQISTPVNNTQPTILYNFIMYAGTA